MNGIVVDMLFASAGAAVLAVLALLVRGAVDILPLSRTRRENISRALPIAAIVVIFAYCLAVVRTLLAAHPTVAAVAMVLVIVGFIAVSWSALRDIISGVFIKAGRVCREGDHVRIDELHGRIAHMGLRILVLETSDGEEAIIPYARLAGDRLLRTPALESISPHVFRLPVQDNAATAQVKTRIRETALLSHWSAASRTPDITSHGGELEVTVYSIDPDRGADIEARVRAAL
jgi:small-conductance mechanosensitive channel